MNDDSTVRQVEKVGAVVVDVLSSTPLIDVRTDKHKSQKAELARSAQKVELRGGGAQNKPQKVQSKPQKVQRKSSYTADRRSPYTEVVRMKVRVDSGLPCKGPLRSHHGTASSYEILPHVLTAIPPPTLPSPHRPRSEP